MELLTQTQVEDRMYRGGINRAENAMARAEAQGRADQTPYAKVLFQEYVLPLAEVLKEEVYKKTAGRAAAHVALLRNLDLEAVAFLAVRQAVTTVIGGLSGQSKNTGHRTVAFEIGRAVHRELVLSQIQDAAPDLYHMLATDLGRRMSKDERHKMTVFTMQAKAKGIPVIEWNTGSREQVGFWLLGKLEDAGLITLGPEYRDGLKHGQRNCDLHPEVVEVIDKIKGHVATTMPVYGPCVEPPLDWGQGIVGGFHTKHMQLVHGSLVRGRRSARIAAREADMPKVHAAVNALQRTAWAVNTRMLNTVYAVAKEFSTAEIVSLNDTPAPPKPEWLKEEWTKEPKDTWPADKLTEFKQWKYATSEWHTERKLLGAKYGRFYAATRAAEMFRDYPAIYFVHFADSRGRLYPLTYGLNPQGSDLSKALIHFSEGLPLTDANAVKWFLVQGANKWGFDKATLEARASWVRERTDLIVSFADDPVNNTDWTKAGDPLQFLAWCFEYADYVRSPETFQSHLPISMDGSCNGLQNLSAMFRDEVGGRATNLTNNEVMQDIYANVAKAATVRLQAKHDACEDAEEKAMMAKWLDFGISRSAVKRTVMTTPYGVTERTATEYIIDDYLRAKLGPTFDPKEYYKAAHLLMSCVWPAIGDVVVKGREAMDWLKKGARLIMKQQKADPAKPTSISWVTPSGFPAMQDYFETEVHRINTLLHGPVKIRVISETDIPDAARHANGLAPNFVHSLDAAHLHLTTAAAAAAGIGSLAMIHDDYGTHAAKAQKLFELIREQFVAMYLACDPPAMLQAKYPVIGDAPTKGSLDIMGVLESDFFFS